MIPGKKIRFDIAEITLHHSEGFRVYFNKPIFMFDTERTGSTVDLH